jgi:hypothetical protein
LSTLLNFCSKDSGLGDVESSHGWTDLIKSWAAGATGPSLATPVLSPVLLGHFFERFQV